MTQNQKLKAATTHIKKIHQEMIETYPNITILGVTTDERKVVTECHAMFWMAALEQKPNAYKEADELIRQIIIGNSVMVDLGIIDKHAELIEH